jgi:formylglycine-generating enzyme required for sulfatase activity
MIWVADGNFTMGSPVGETGRSTDETEHNVTLTKGFYLGKYEVTQAQYAVVMSGNSNSLNPSPSNWPNNPNRPVEKVSWVDVQIFLARLNASEQVAGRLPSGWSYVLPTEAEWEYACRAGTTTAYSWGPTIATSNANYSSSGISQTTDVGQYAANPWGFFNMHGNVREWTSGSGPVFRGGSWGDSSATLRSAIRGTSYPGDRDSRIGFRVGFKQQ